MPNKCYLFATAIKTLRLFQSGLIRLYTYHWEILEIMADPHKIFLPGQLVGHFLPLEEKTKASPVETMHFLLHVQKRP